VLFLTLSFSLFQRATNKQSHFKNTLPPSPWIEDSLAHPSASKHNLPFVAVVMVFAERVVL